MEDRENHRDIKRTGFPAIEDLGIDLDLGLAGPVDEVELGHRLREFESKVEDLIAWLKADRMCTGARPSIGRKTLWS